MHEPLRFELDDATLAESLRRELALFDAELEQLGGVSTVRVELITAKPETLITSALRTVDAWLARTRTPAVWVHLDGRAYTLTAPQTE